MTDVSPLVAQAEPPDRPDMAKIEQDCLNFAALSCLGSIKQAYRLFHAQGKTEEDFDRCAWDAMAKAVKRAVDLTAREVRDPVWPYAAPVQQASPSMGEWLKEAERLMDAYADEDVGFREERRAALLAHLRQRSDHVDSSSRDGEAVRAAASWQPPPNEKNLVEPALLQYRVRDGGALYGGWHNADAEAFAVAQRQPDVYEVRKLYAAPAAQPTWTRLYAAVNEMMVYLGAHGSIAAKGDRAQAVMEALHAIDGGTVAQPVPPAQPDIARKDALLRQAREAIRDAFDTYACPRTSRVLEAIDAIAAELPKEPTT
jgi:hypothetical protein